VCTIQASWGVGCMKALLPILSEISGFVDYYFVDTGNGSMVSISVFENQVGVEKSNNRAVEWVQQNTASLISKPPQVADGRVVSHKVA
jgi:hypothetical protein